MSPRRSYLANRRGVRRVGLAALITGAALVPGVAAQAPGGEEPDPTVRQDVHYAGDWDVVRGPLRAYWDRWKSEEAAAGRIWNDLGQVINSPGSRFEGSSRADAVPRSAITAMIRLAKEDGVLVGGSEHEVATLILEESRRAREALEERLDAERAERQRRREEEARRRREEEAGGGNGSGPFGTGDGEGGDGPGVSGDPGGEGGGDPGGNPPTPGANPGEGGGSGEPGSPGAPGPGGDEAPGGDEPGDPGPGGPGPAPIDPDDPGEPGPAPGGDPPPADPDPDPEDPPDLIGDDPEPTDFLGDRRDIPYGQAHPRQVLDIYLPEGAGPGAAPVPTIVFFHGGGFIRGDKGDVEGFLGWVQAGYALASVNYKLLNRASQADVDFLEDVGEIAEAAYDARAAVRWLRENAGTYGLDPDRFAAIGGSAGGYLAAVVGSCGDEAQIRDEAPTSSASAAVKLVVDISGPTDFATFPEHAGQGANPFGVEAARAVLNGQGAVSPFEFVDAGDPPTMLRHGRLDTVVPYQQSTTYGEALRAAGISTDEEILDGVGHSLPPDQLERAIADVLGFLDNNL